MSARRDRSLLEVMRNQATSDLTTDLLPFWTRQTLDTKYGGLDMNLYRYGAIQQAGPSTSMQARMVWTLSAAWEFGIHNPRYKSLADSGVKFMTTKMWIPKYGGFYMSVLRGMERPTIRKNRFTRRSSFSTRFRKTRRVFHNKPALYWAEKTWAEIEEGIRSEVCRLPRGVRSAVEAHRRRKR